MSEYVLLVAIVALAMASTFRHRNELWCAARRESTPTNLLGTVAVLALILTACVVVSFVLIVAQATTPISTL